MRIRVHHTSRYRYSRPVALGRHVFRFRPRADGVLLLRDFRLRVHPRPVVWSECMDLDGNSTVEADFDCSTEALTVIAQSSVETLRTNPFDFVVEASWATLPVSDAGCLAAQLAPYRNRDETADLVDEFAFGVLREVGNQTAPFLTGLNRRISEVCSAKLRLEGVPQSPADTLRQGQGACRDLAVLFIDACRALGLAARFVSGYAGNLTREGPQYLHAWAEVYLPGGGWRGFDPTTGLAVADRHIAVAASANSRQAAPIVGHFRGSDVVTDFSVDLNFEVDSESHAGQDSRSS